MEPVAGKIDRLYERGGDFKLQRARAKSLHGKVYNGGKGAQRVPQQHGGVHGAPARSPKVVWLGWDDFSRCKSIF